MDEYLPGIQAGDAEAFGRWLAVAERPLRASLRPFAATVDTEAVVQETFLRVWRFAGRIVPDGRPDAVVRFAIRVARNLAISELRRLRLEPAELDELERKLHAQAGDPDVRAGASDPLLRKTLEKCREELPEKPADCLRARLDNEGSDPDESLAERLGMKLNTFLQNITRARKFLADCLARQGVEAPH